MEHFKTCLNLSLLAHLDFETQLSDAARAGFKTVGLRMNTLQDYLAAGNTLDQAKQLIIKYGLDPLEMNFFSMWIYANQVKQPEVFAEFREFASVAHQIGSQILVCTPGYLDEATKDMGSAVENYQELCKIAAEYNLIVGLEFVPWCPVGNVKKAWDIIERANQPNGGLVLDCFHYFEGDSSLADLEKVPIEKVIMFHIMDVERVANESPLKLCHNYRLLPGEGEYNYDGLLKYLTDRNYQGYYNLEIMYSKYQTMDGLELAKRAKKAVDALLANFSNRWKLSLQGE
jgi:sugar phosphate isomerase/epimerase